MKILPIIQHLRTYMPEWFRNIDAGATWEQITDKSRLALPAFYVSLKESSVTKYYPQPPEILIEDSVSIIAVLKNTYDQTGKYAQDQVEDLRTALISSLMGWVNLPDSTCMIFRGDKMLAMDNSRYIHEFSFSQETRVDWSQGFQPSVDNFNNMFVDWNLTEASEETAPQAQDEIVGLYDLPPRPSTGV